MGVNPGNGFRDGTVLDQGRVRHVYVLRDGLIARMDVEEHTK
jgi:hypothetical protein